MALALSLGIGEAFYVDDTKATVVDALEDGTGVVLEVKGVRFDITDRKKEEVLPDVLVSAGHFNHFHGQFKLIIDAPRRIKIVRESLLNG